ncbi:hypothetical protein EVA_20825 [gut metagenome]|uniref:Uncharacterized protein n=1 Tax=gut metagenome TaxID=749906 RepID=J9BU61_9ZZZZ
MPYFRERPNSCIRFKGEDLIMYKKAGLPKRGRKFKNRNMNDNSSSTEV